MSQDLELLGRLLEKGLTRRQIAERLGISNPRVSQIIRNHPELIRRQARPELIASRLRGYREDLIRIRTATLHLGRQVSRELRTLNEELEAYEIDTQLGLRAG